MVSQQGVRDDEVLSGEFLPPVVLASKVLSTLENTEVLGGSKSM